MSYVRWGPESTVYVYADVAGGFTCCGCAMRPDGGSVNVPTGPEMAEHLRAHVAVGHLVPKRVMAALEVARAEDPLR